MTRNKLLISLSALLFLGQTCLSQVIIDSINPASVSDGPYVFWINDSTLSVSRICAGEHHAVDLTLSDSVLIADCCGLSELPEVVAYRPQLQSDQWQFENVSRLFALSDIHGEYHAMVDILISSGVVDSLLNWTFDDGHLVFDGDIFDKGTKVTECLWLIYRLEHQAKAAGGNVHYLLGNHELMVLSGDEHRVHQRYTQVSVTKIGRDHAELYGPNSMIGQWLRSKNSLILIDSILFVHGGISPDLVSTELTIPQINDLARKWIDQPKPEVKADSTANLLYGRLGPFWYRGLTWSYAGYARQSSAELTDLLSYFGAKSVVVGHSEQDSLQGYYGNQLFAIDVPVADLGGLQGLLFENDRFFRVDPDGTRTPIIADSNSVPKYLHELE